VEKLSKFLEKEVIKRMREVYIIEINIDPMEHEEWFGVF